MKILVYERDGSIDVFDNTDGLGYLKLFNLFCDFEFYYNIKENMNESKLFKEAKMGLADSAKKLLYLRINHEYEDFIETETK